MFASMGRILTLVMALLLAAMGTAWAGPQDYIQDKHKELSELLQKGGSDGSSRISAIFDSMLDYQSLAEHSLGEHWAGLTEEQRREFKTVLEGLVKNAYEKSLHKTLDYEVSMQGETPLDEGVLVKTVAKHRAHERDAPVSIDYALHKVGTEWKVYDIVTEGSSLVKNYRSQFTRVIKKKGFAELLSRMRKKLAEK